jgi:UDP-N-acetylglucosamine--N-acetylmuramyl-(pentapeptide) pyrophosphoryl-undecaprenol N-acetylglucosamine transferase
MTNYLLAGGGTGGHVNPLLALAERIREIEPESKVLALGTKEGLESKLVPARGFELLTIERLPFPRKPSGYALAFPLRFNRAVREIRQMISEREINVVVGFGGYASAPAYVAARRSKVPYVIHEANALPGMANKLGAGKAAAVAVAFKSTKLKNAVFTGMPLRAEIETAIASSSQKVSRVEFGLDPNTPTLLVTGGSLGARSINNAVAGAESSLDAAGVQVIHIVGGNSDLPEVKTKSLVRIKYCESMDQAIAAADLAVCRSGASTVCEFGSFGLPSVFVPYPVGNGEQRFNAADLVEAGGAVLIDDSNFDSDYVRDQIIPLISNSKRLRDMSKAAKTASIADGTKRLYELVRSVLPSNPKSSK